MRRTATAAALTLLSAVLGLVVLTGPATAATTSTATQEAQVVKLINAARAKKGCAPLRTDARLTKAARAHSADMAKRRYFAHNSPGGVTPWTRIARAGYPSGASLAENIAAGQTTPAAVVKAWLNSPAHKANIMKCSLKASGVGLARGGPYGYYWTQDFGSK